MSGANDPAYLGLQSAALLVQGEGEDQQNLARRGLRAALDQRWPLSFLGSEHDAQMVDVAVGDRTPVYTIDVYGLTSWDIGSARATERHYVARTLNCST